MGISRRQRRASLLTVCLVWVGTFVMGSLPGGRVGACSCAAELPTLADKIGTVDLVFVGRLVATETLDEAARQQVDPQFGEFDVRYELVVEHAVKGVAIGDEVVMYGTTAPGNSCGTSELDPTVVSHAVFSWSYQGVFLADSTPPCMTLPTVDELTAVDLTLPPTSPGPVSLIIVGRAGTADIIGYDATGMPTAYGNLAGWSSGPAVCPGSTRFALIEQASTDAMPTLAIRDTATLDVIGRHAFDGLDSADEHLRWQLASGAYLACGASDGSDVTLLLPREMSSDESTRVIRVLDGATTVRSYSNANGARLDPEFEGDAVSAVAELDGELVRLTGSGDAPPESIGQVSEPGGPLLRAVTILPDGSGGWWVGLGDGQYGEADQLRLLAHIDADGTIRRWTVEPNVDAYSLRIEGDALVSDVHEIPLPDPAGTHTNVVPGPRTTPPRPGRALGDGRTVVWNWDGEQQTIEMVAADGSTVTLAHLAEMSTAVAVPEGPLVDPTMIDRNPPVLLVDSEWITRAESAPQPSTQPVATTPATSASTAPPVSTSPPPTEPGTTQAPVDPSSSATSAWLTVAALIATGLGVAAFVVVLSRRKGRLPQAA
ncbi:MAG TPA: hypothetical protein VMM60_11525 [Ilumatobacter sp.]|nr:hypothetical protein [Ilumatobacter sp.]